MKLYSVHAIKTANKLVEPGEAFEVPDKEGARLLKLGAATKDTPGARAKKAAPAKQAANSSPDEPPPAA